MKKFICILVISVALGASTTGRAALVNFTGSSGSYSASASPGATIPDSPGTGLAYALNFNFSGFTSIQSISVTLNISGSYNGDLYVYLSHGSGLGILLNRVGASGSDAFGYSTAGFNNITLGMSGTDIHTVETPTTGGTYASDGRFAYTSSTRDNTLNVFSGANPNGDWTLYFEDQSAVSVATLNSWSVDITAVPEPANVALLVFGGLFAGVAGWRAFRRWHERA